jgi:BMFP domain-containing protein YqiC
VRPRNRHAHPDVARLRLHARIPVHPSLIDAAMDPRFIDDLARRLSAAVPPSVAALRRDLEENFKAVLQSALTRLDLVSRQEFDVQSGVLLRTREKLEALEARLAQLESARAPAPQAEEESPQKQD